MPVDARHARVVAALIASMTFGAALLLWLEPERQRWPDDRLLMAERGGRVESVVIEVVPASPELNPAEFDCVILPDGACDWRPRGPHVRLAVIDDGREALPREQAGTLMAALGAMSQTRGLNLVHVGLLPAADGGGSADSPGLASDLRRLLVRKGILP